MKRLMIYVDIDKTICTSGNPVPEQGNMTFAEWREALKKKYETSEPIVENIEAINMLFEAGHGIVYWTSRGVGSDQDLREMTEKQLESWGAKYHDLLLNKPVYDVLIDDKAVNNFPQLVDFLEGLNVQS